MDSITCESQGILPLRTNTGFHRCGSVRRSFVCGCYGCHESGRASTTAKTSLCDGMVVEADPKVLGSTPFLAPRNVGSRGHSSQLVSFSLILAITCL